MSRKNLQHITLKRETVNEKSLSENPFLTAETINLKSTYTPEDLKRVEKKMTTDILFKKYKNYI